VSGKNHARRRRTLQISRRPSTKFFLLSNRRGQLTQSLKSETIFKEDSLMKKLFTVIESMVLLGVLVSTASAADVFKPDSQGYIRHWVMLAPIALPEEGSGADLIVKEQIENEATLKPKDGDRIDVKNQEMVWMSVETSTNYVDFNKILVSENDRKAGFIVTYIECEKELPGVTMAIASNDQGRCYLNGKEVFVYTEQGPLQLDSGKPKVTLNKGVNVVVFKLINEAGNWQAALRFLDTAGAPIKNLKIKLAP
jgi:hypothetical protein